MFGSRLDKVDIRKLKSFAYGKLPRNLPIREILLLEEDELDVQVFLARLSIWLQLSKLKTGDDKCP